ncbi:MAG: hypothetical protein AABZ60_07060 [Planctomycetota bacterium]
MFKSLPKPILALLFLMSFQWTALAQDKSRPEYRKAAEVVRLTALRNLAESVLGILIKSGTEVNNFVTQKDVVVTKVSGKMYGVSYSNVSYDQANQILKVTARISREDAIEALKASEISGATKLPEASKFFDAIGEAVYEEKTTSSENIEKQPTTFIEIEHTSSFSEQLLAKSFVYLQLATILFEETGASFPYEDLTLLLESLKNRTKVYLGLNGQEGLQLEFRLDQADIQLLLEAFILNFTTCDSATAKAKEQFRQGILLGCLIKGNETFPLPKQTTGWYEKTLNLAYPIAFFLTQETKTLPSMEILETIQKAASVQFLYFSGYRELQFSYSYSTETNKTYLKFAGIISGSSLLENNSWITLGTSIECPKSSGSDFAEYGYFQAKQNAQKRAETLVIEYLENYFGLALKSLPMTPPLFQGFHNQKEVVLNLAYSKSLLLGYLKQKYTDEQLKIFQDTIGDGILVWASSSL